MILIFTRTGKIQPIMESHTASNRLLLLYNIELLKLFYKI